MRKATLATLFILLCAAWAMAQQDYGQNSGSSSSDKTTVQGCLNKSDSGYTLTDKSGTTYQLTGNTSKLSAHVGHEVQIKGTKSGSGAAAATSTSAAGTSTASSQTAQPQLQVSSMKHISETCSSTSSGSSEKSPSSGQEKPPMSEKPPTAK